MGGCDLDVPLLSSKKAVQDVLSKGQVCILDIDMQVGVCAGVCLCAKVNHRGHGSYTYKLL